MTLAIWLQITCRRIIVELAVAISLSLLAATSASASLKISSFSIEGTANTRVTQVGKAVEVVNEPYSPSYSQAGGRPWALTSTLEIESETIKSAEAEIMVPTQDPKDIVVDLPPGLLGDPMATPRCSFTHVSNSAEQCPTDTQVGVYELRYKGGKELLAPIVNTVPEKGQSAEFALENTAKVITPILTAHLVHTSAGYGFSVTSKEIPTLAITQAELTFWGVPADPSHDQMRGLFCIRASVKGALECEGGNKDAGATATPFLTMPSSCASGPELATVRADSWQEPGTVGVAGEYAGHWTEAHTPLPAATGCEALQFNPGTGVEVKPETTLADEPVGLGVNLQVPLNEEPDTNSAPLLRDTAVTLPEGMSVSPGIVDGIQACDATGPSGIDIEGSESERLGPDGEWQLAPGHCPDASVVGTAEAITPFLPEPVKGHVYLARPGCGGVTQPPCTEQDALDGNLYKLYLELGGEGELGDAGIVFKVPLETHANPATGQLTTNASELLQAPYNEVRIHLNGGPRAPLDNPARCGSAVTTADLTPWSAPGVTGEGLVVAGTPDALSSSFFKVEGCQQPTPFNPGFLAGTVIPRAGQFSTFTMNLTRGDREQYIAGVQLHTPPGLLAMLASVPLCQEPLADEGRCPAGSEIGTTRVASGAGSHPFEIEGAVYLTGPHDGAPYGLSIVTHATAGPFNLGLVVVRARIDVDSRDSTALITTDQSGPYSVPQIIFGVPLRLQRISVDIDRPGFMFNPTSCASQRVVGHILGAQGAVAEVSSPFAAGACRSLSFKPTFSVSTNAHTSRTLGASLDAKVTYPSGSVGVQANVARVKVSLPRQLPSRLTTLQKACPARVFESNPGNCPGGSVIGVARAVTPVLPEGLTGPVYFVSHGGEEFPELVVVLEGDNLRVDLIGTTFISKSSITSSTFKSVPDVPVRSFELYLPQGRDSALAANGNLCSEKAKLKMPTDFIAQNGLEMKQTTMIKVTGCPARKARHAKSGGKRK